MRADWAAYVQNIVDKFVDETVGLSEQGEIEQACLEFCIEAEIAPFPEQDVYVQDFIVTWVSDFTDVVFNGKWPVGVDPIPMDEWEDGSVDSDDDA